MRRGGRRRGGRRGRALGRANSGSPRRSGVATSRRRGGAVPMTEAMNRRDFLMHAGGAAAAAALGAPARAFAQPSAETGWRTFELTTRVEVLQAGATTRVWLPTPLPAAPYQQTAGDTYHAAGGRTVMIETNANDPDILAAVWEDGNPAVLTLTSRVSTRGHAVDLSAPSVPPPRDLSAFGHFLRPTKFIPTDGIVKKTADAITRGAGTDLERAR